MEDDSTLEGRAAADPSGLTGVVPPETPIRMSEATMIAATALNLALKYHDTNMVKDAGMYQQYKLDGHNLRGLSTDWVFETAKEFERHIMTAPERLSSMVAGIITEALTDMPIDYIDKLEAQCRSLGIDFEPLQEANTSMDEYVLSLEKLINAKFNEDDSTPEHKEADDASDEEDSGDVP